MTTSTTTRLNVSGLGGPLFLAYTNNGNAVQPAADGTLVVDSRDVPSLLTVGASYINQVNRQATVSAPLAATAGRIVSSTTLANGTLSIANQPDVPRRVAAVLAHGSTAVTGGALTLSYLANDGTNQADAFALSAISASTGITYTSSKGVLSLTSAIVTGLAGAANAGVQINDTNSLSLIVDAGYQDFGVSFETAAGTPETVGVVASSAASVTPSTTPNGSLVFGFVYGYLTPSS